MLSGKYKLYGFALQDVKMIVEHAQSKGMDIDQAAGMDEGLWGAVRIPLEDVKKVVGRNPIEIAP